MSTTLPGKFHRDPADQIIVATALDSDCAVVTSDAKIIAYDIEPDDVAHPIVDDVLDVIGALAVKMGGQIVIVPAERMPTKTGIAAIYRY